MSSVAWGDSEGIGILTNGMPAPGNRFANWTPDRVPIGPAAVGLGTGTTYRFEFRRDDLISFEIPYLKGEAQLDLALRLKHHLMNGGFVSLDTDRPLASRFAQSKLAPDTVPTIEFTDRQTLEYTFSVQLKALSDDESSGGGGGILYPAFVPGLKLWLKGDNATLAATKEDEDFIGGWYDDSGLGNDAVQAIEGGQPRYRTNMANGFPVVRFDGVDDFLLTPQIMVPTVSPGTTLFWVARRSGVAVENGVFFCFQNGSETTGVMTSTVVEDGSSDPGDLKYQIVDPFPAKVTIGSGTAGEFHVYCLTFESTTIVRSYLDGVAGPTFDVYDPLHDNLRDMIRLGRVGGVFEPYACQLDFAEMFWFLGIINAPTRNGLTRYLGLKYGITVTT